MREERAKSKVVYLWTFLQKLKKDSNNYENIFNVSLFIWQYKTQLFFDFLEDTSPSFTLFLLVRFICAVFIDEIAQVDKFH